MAHILVTGANGFIGSHLVRQLLELKKNERWDEDIACLVRSCSYLESLKGLDVRIIVGDITSSDPADEKALKTAIKGAKYIFHLAAVVCGKNKSHFRESIVDGTHNILETVATCVNEDLDKTGQKTLERFVYVSTIAATGPVEVKKGWKFWKSIDIEQVRPREEDDRPPNYKSHYGQAKWDAEEKVRASASSNGFDYTIIRPCAVYGEEDIIFSPIIKLVDKHIHPKTGFGKRYAGMIYVKDLVDGIVKAARHAGAKNKAYFMVNSRRYTHYEIIKETAKAIGKPCGFPIPVPIFCMWLFGLFKDVASWITRYDPMPNRDYIKDMKPVYWLWRHDRAKDDFDWPAPLINHEGVRKNIEWIKDEEKKLREMPNEKPLELFAKFSNLALFLGIAIELIAVNGAELYFFTPWWLILPAIVGFWGLLYGSIACVLRTYSAVIRYLSGFLPLFIADLLNTYWLHFYEYTYGSFLDSVDPLLRAAIVGAVAGFVIPITNAWMIMLYKRKLRLG